MKKIILFITVILTGFTMNLNAQSTASTTSSASAKLIRAMTLTETAALDFGSNLLTSPAGGTVVLSSDNNVRGYTGGVVAATLGVAVNGAYDVTGTALETYALTLPGTITVTHQTAGGGARTMAIVPVARFKDFGIDATTSTLDEDGEDSFTLGGTLTIVTGQVAGVYAGTFPISVDYN
jgi:hypothetical protein